jgi:hypothetical protein
MTVFDKSIVRRGVVALLLLVSFLSFHSSSAITTTFNASVDNDWNNALNWTNGIPTASDDAVVAAGFVNITTTGTIVMQSLVIKPSAILVIGGTGGPNTFTVNGPTNVEAGANLIITTVHNSFNGLVTIEAGGVLQVQGGGSLIATGNDVIVDGIITNLAGDLSFRDMTVSGDFDLSIVAVNVNIFGRSITFNLGATADFKNRPGTVVQLSQDFTNNSGALIEFGMNVSFVPDGASTIIDGSIGGISLYNVTVNDGKSLTIAGIVDLYGVLTLAGTGSFNTGSSGTGQFTVKSTSRTEGGQIANLPNPANFTGSLTIERFIHTGDSDGDYRYLSVPINTDVTPVNLGLWKDAFGVTGNFSDPSTNAEFPTTIRDELNTNPSVFTHNGLAYQPLAAAGSPVSTVALSGTTGYVAYNFKNQDVTVSYEGEIQKGLLGIPISNTGGRFNLTPNPFPATIDWDQFSPTSLTNFMWLRTAKSVFATYERGGGSNTNPPAIGWAGEVAIGQCFWTESTGSSSSFDIGESSKNTSSTSSTFVRKGSTKPSSVRITLSSSTQKDEAIIRFDEGASDGKDLNLDAVKFRNGIFISPIGRNNYLNVSSYTTDAKSDFVFNTIAPLELNVTTKTVNLKVADVGVGDYTLQVSPENFALGYGIVLTDKFLNKQVELKGSVNYAFTVTDNVESFGDKRFTIDFVQAVTAVADEQNAFEIYPNPVVNDKLKVIIPSVFVGKVEGISIVDMEGRTMIREAVKDSSEVVFDVSNFKTATYVVSIKLGNGVFKSYRIVKK